MDVSHPLNEYEHLISPNDPVYLMVNLLIQERPKICAKCDAPNCPLQARVTEDDLSEHLPECPMFAYSFTCLEDRILSLQLNDPNNHQKPWVGFALDGTLSKSVPTDCYTFGDPVGPMIDLAKRFLEQDIRVKILTPRVALSNPNRALAARRIRRWTKKHLGVALESTAQKDDLMVTSYDGLTHQVIVDEGRLVESLLVRATNDLKKAQGLLVLRNLGDLPPTIMH